MNPDHFHSLVWLRRDLRLHDHAALAEALKGEGRIQPVFVFDSGILERFSSKKDRRITFISSALWKMHTDLTEKNSGLLVVYGRAAVIVPILAKALRAKQLVCSEDFEPETRRRDAVVREALEKEGIAFTTVLDHLVFSPRDVRKADGTPYLIFTPYSKAWRAKLGRQRIEERKAKLGADRLAEFSMAAKAASDAGLTVIDMERGAEGIVRQVGYEYNPHPLWSAGDGAERLRGFIGRSINNYASSRDLVAEEGTSMLSPYLRHGLVSIREALRLAVEQEKAGAWINELIWREFYAMILYYFPESAQKEWQKKYRELHWVENSEQWKAFAEGRTGFPIVDAAMRQLLETGWMHNRARMIVASFLTKDLHLDWRLGEEHFAQWLMDYELASNVGGWQWAASTGTDAVPYFRVFNPLAQSKKFDPAGEYIRRWVPELRHVKGEDIHQPSPLVRLKDYPAPIVDHGRERLRALEMYKTVGEGQ